MSQPIPTPTPRTLSEVIADLQERMLLAQQEIDQKRAELRTAELRHATLLGQLQAYTSLQIPAEISHGDEA